MNVRDSRETDLEAVFEIFNREIVEGVNAFDTEPIEGAAQKHWFEIHRNPRFPLIVVEEQGMVIGWAGLSPWARHGAYVRTVELSVFVHAQYRSRGVGKVLIDRLVEEARRQGHHVVVARAEASNEASRQLHLSRGFVEVGVMKEVGWKHGRYLDVIVFQLML